MQKALVYKIYRFVIVAILSIAALGADAQFYSGLRQNFGRARMQFTDEFWSFYRFDHYEVYFYTGGKQLAVYTAKFAHEEIKRMQGELDFVLDNRIQFVVFNKLSDLKQSNIGILTDDYFNTGSVTHIVGTKVFVYFQGDYKDLEKQIRAGIAEVILNQLMFGETLASNVKNSTLITLPPWFFDGLVSYLSQSWSTELDNLVKDGVMSGHYRRFNHLEGQEAVRVGHSIWYYIAQKYGKKVIPSIVYMTRVSRNIETGIMFVLGISYDRLITEWRRYYRGQFELSDEVREQLPTGNLQKKRIKPSHVYQQLKINPDTQLVCYTTNELGKYKVWIQHTETNQRAKIMKGGFKLDEKTDYSYPLLRWHPTGKLLTIITEEKGALWLYYYTLETGEFDRLQLFEFDKVLSFDYSHDGVKIVLSATQNGQSDIYVHDRISHNNTRVTKDIYDDLQPCFINNSTGIVFSSNRPGDTLQFFVDNMDFSFRDVNETRDLFLYKYKEKNNVLQRMTFTPHANESSPVEYDNNYVGFLSDQNGIRNRYVARFDSAVSFIDTITHYRHYTTTLGLTDRARSILEQDISPETGTLAEIVLQNNRYHMYLHNRIDASELKSVDAHYTSFMYNLKLDSVKRSGRMDTNGTQQPEPRPVGDDSLKEIPTQAPTRDEVIDINNYWFDEDLEPGRGQTSQNMLQNRRIAEDADGKFTMPRQQNYDVEYSIEKLASQIDFSFLNLSYQSFAGGNSPIYINPGLNVLLQVGVSDLLENYKINGGVSISPSLENNEYVVGFNNLKRRLDKQIVFHRNLMDYNTGRNYFNSRSHEIYYVLTWPFTPVLSCKWTSMLKSERLVTKSTDLASLKIPNAYTNWLGMKGELIFDNTRNKGLNLFYGARWKLFGELQEEIGMIKNNALIVGMDFRHYTKLHRTFIWANRLAASASLGNHNLIYYMGGVDQWLFPKFNNDINISYDQNYRYQTLATNMRGFTQNIRNGTSFAVINSELRMPLFRYFSGKPIKSDFLYNFQIVTFGDLGTAWTGPNPYSDENSLYRQVIRTESIRVTIVNQKEPVVGGFGVGLRSKLLGYFVRADLAWGVEDFIIQPKIFYLSLGTDF